ncbi:MAG: winged helix-turn-helix domain-containing protein [Curvibacter sp.]
MDILFEDFVLAPHRRELNRNGAVVALEPQVFDLLVYLVHQRGRVVSKDELIKAVWGGRIVSDSTIESRVSLLRKALCDDGQRQRLVRTYARKGLRFVGEVREAGAADRIEILSSQGRAIPVVSTARWPADGRPTVAVLPLLNLSHDPGQDHVCDGIAADLIALFARQRSLLVVARNSSFAFRGRDIDARQLGEALGADYLVEGSFRRARRRLHITFGLVDTRDGRTLWAERYDRDVEDIFAVQDDIAAQIAGRIEPEINLCARQRVLRQPPQSLQAWDAFHLGMSHLYKATAADNLQAQDWLRRTIALDPGFAQAHAFLSYAIVLSMLYFEADPLPQRIEEAVAIAALATYLDYRVAAARFTLGRALTVRQDYDDALAELSMATDLNPALAIGWCGLADAHAYAGEFTQAFRLFQKAIDLSPHDPMLWAFFSYRALAHLFAGEFADAADDARRAIHMPQCHYWPYAHRAAALGQLGEREEAGKAAAELLRIRPEFSCTQARRRLFYVRSAGQLELYVQGLRRAGLPA